MFFSAVLSLGLAAIANAAVHDVTVGGSDGKLVFNPEAVSAVAGDQVVFHFQAKNHTATQSSFASPCAHKDGGFDSGFMPVPANQTDNFPTYTITVNDTAPIWVYCRQAANLPTSHCGKGMIFAVNCPADGSPNSLSNFKKEALDIGASLAAAAAASSTGSDGGYGSPTPTSADSASYTDTAAYGGATIPPAATAVTVTDTITLQSSTWTTTYASYPNSPNPTPASLQGNVIKVVVGGTGQLTFNPPHVQAQPKDTIMFEFQSKNHTVTLSSFASPCIGAKNTSGAFNWDSGFQAVANGTVEGQFPVVNYTVSDTAPAWFYCRQKTPASHCGAGMVFAVNSDESSPRSFAAFQTLAKQLNGTTANSTSPTGTPAPASGAGRVGGMAVTASLGVVAAVFVALL